MVKRYFDRLGRAYMIFIDINISWIQRYLRLTMIKLIYKQFVLKAPFLYLVQGPKDVKNGTVHNIVKKY